MNINEIYKIEKLAGLFLIAIVIGVTIASALVFIKTAHAINTYPVQDFMVSDDMASYMMKQGHLQDFEEEDVQ